MREARPFYGLDLAYIHHAGFGDLAKAAVPGLLRLLRRAGIRDGLIVDLGSGSGILARELTARGYDVLGVDRSAEMVRLARTVAPRARFTCAAIADLPLPPCRAAFATGESISYPAPGARRAPSLRPLFARIARALEPGGLFVFDLIVAVDGPPMAYRTCQAGHDWAVLADVREDRASRLVKRRITTFRARGGVYRRREERHAVGVYDAGAVRLALSSVGFRVTVRRAYGRVALPPRRMVFVARRLRTPR